MQPWTAGNLSLQKACKAKANPTWWLGPVTEASREAEAGGSQILDLELVWATYKFMDSLGNIVSPCSKQTKEERFSRLRVPSLAHQHQRNKRKENEEIKHTMKVVTPATLVGSKVS